MRKGEGRLAASRSGLTDAFISPMKLFFAFAKLVALLWRSQIFQIAVTRVSSADDYRSELEFAALATAARAQQRQPAIAAAYMPR